ncbi:MAG: hypothetical protein GY862_16260, partial [Gammaproteobacteria bacterium]|nr:hypothetical protein [Gammaproteobacteria bacterium]
SLFAHFKELNAIELKGYNDPLTVKDFNRVMMRAWGLGAVKWKRDKDKAPPSKLPSQRTLTIVCVSKPKKILKDLQSVFGFKHTKEQGVYQLKSLLDICLICPSELSICKRNYPLLPLARGEKLEQFISLCMRKGLNDYLELILHVGFAADPEAVWQKITEVYKMKHVIHEETWPVIDEFFREVPEAMGKLRTLQDALRAKLSEGRKKGRKKGRSEGKQTALIRILKCKFQTVPKNVIQTIEKTHGSERLDHWLDQVITAGRIDEIDF